MNKDKMKGGVVIAAGGTGGHVFPALALHQGLPHSMHSQLVMDERGAKLLTSTELPLKVLRFTPPQRNRFVFACHLLWNSCFMLWSMFKSRPKMVIAFGGYPCIPTLIAAVMLRIPIVLHESNAVLGKSNRWFLPWAKMLMTGFPRTRNIGHRYQWKVYYTGTPVRRELLQSTHHHQMTNLQLLVMGGSQGASIIDREVPIAVAKLSLDLRQRLHLIQQARPENLPSVYESYRPLQLASYDIQPFFTNAIELIHKSQLVLARSGAGTISEVTSLGRASLLIPLACAKDHHQQYNAEYLQQIDAAVLIAEHEVPEKLGSELQRLLQSIDLLAEMGLNAAKASHSHSVDKMVRLLSPLFEANHVQS